MADRAEVYVPVSMTPLYRRQAFRSWAAVLTLVLVWVAAIIFAPIARANGLVDVSAALYRFFSFICHQIPARSFFIDGEPFGVCSRCFGVYFGLFVGVAVYPLWRRIDTIDTLPRIWLILSMVPIAVDWSLTIFGVWENTFVSRFLTGFILGFACATYIVPAVVEIVRNFTMRRATRRPI